MSTQAKQWGAIIVMIALFAMIAFVTNLCTPMASIIQNDLAVSPVLAQVGNYGNFIAYLLLGIPSGMLISKIGYKKTALAALLIGIVGIGIQWLSGQMDPKTTSTTAIFCVYLAGAFIAGCTMCMLNTVVNPMLNILGGGGNGGNQLIQIGGVFNSSAAVCVYILMGAMIGDAARAHIADATPALLIAMAIFVVGFIVILFTKIEEPEQAPVDLSLIKGAMSFRHFNLGILGIGLYMGIEVGVPNYIQQYLSSPTDASVPGMGMDGGIVGLIVAVYWFMMLIGRFVGGSIGGKFSARAMISTVATTALVLIAFGMLAPAAWTVNVPGVDWANLSIITAEVPVGIFAFLLVGLCTSVMWGGIFNMAVEGLGKYTAMASGIFMTMVFFCAIMQFIQAKVAEIMGSYLGSYIVPLLCAAYVLFYALIGSRVSRRAE